MTLSGPIRSLHVEELKAVVFKKAPPPNIFVFQKTPPHIKIRWVHVNVI